MSVYPVISRNVEARISRDPTTARKLSHAIPNYLATIATLALGF